MVHLEDAATPHDLDELLEGVKHRLLQSIIGELDLLKVVLNTRGWRPCVQATTTDVKQNNLDASPKCCTKGFEIDSKPPSIGSCTSEVNHLDVGLKENCDASNSEKIEPERELLVVCRVRDLKPLNSRRECLSGKVSLALQCEVLRTTRKCQGHVAVGTVVRAVIAKGTSSPLVKNNVLNIYNFVMRSAPQKGGEKVMIIKAFAKAAEGQDEIRDPISASDVEVVGLHCEAPREQLQKQQPRRHLRRASEPNSSIMTPAPQSGTQSSGKPSSVEISPIGTRRGRPRRFSCEETDFSCATKASPKQKKLQLTKADDASPKILCAKRMPSCQNAQPFRGVVRDIHERNQYLKSFDCTQCREWFSVTSDSRCKAQNNEPEPRHKYVTAPSCTPAGYWDPNFPESQPRK